MPSQESNENNNRIIRSTLTLPNASQQNVTFYYNLHQQE